MSGHLRKIYPNESGSLDSFYFVRCYVDEEVYLESKEEAEHLVVWGLFKSLFINKQFPLLTSSLALY